MWDDPNYITETDKFVFFWRGFMSQWYPSMFVVDRIEYNCCEQYMMSEKARMFNDVETTEKIMASKSPKVQKDLGRQVRGFDPQKWNSDCRDIVWAGNLAKFTQNPELRAKLLATGDKILVEASPLDVIWGIGLEASDKRALNQTEWLGTNWLGEALMRVRSNIKNLNLIQCDE